jgi:hypothetical protein
MAAAGRSVGGAVSEVPGEPDGGDGRSGTSGGAGASRAGLPPQAAGAGAGAGTGPDAATLRGVPVQSGPAGRHPTAAASSSSLPPIAVSRTPEIAWDAPAVGDEATRYLCAAAHLDAVFTRQALREFVFDDGRAPAPNSGVDDILVLRHCLVARARRLHRDVALCVVMLVALLTSAWAVAAWLLWAGGLRVLLIADADRGVRSSSLARFVALLWGVAGVFGLAVVTGIGHPLPFGWQVAGHAGKHGGFRMTPWVCVPLGALAVAWTVALMERLAARHTLVDRLRRDRFGTHRWVTTESVWARRALGELAARQAGDRQVLADPARPFAGSGRHVLRRRWLLETGPIRYDVADFVERVTERLAEGAFGLDPARLLESVEWDDFAVATGPVLVTGHTEDATLRLLPSGRGAAAPRVYRRFRIVDDPAETVVSAYLAGHSAPGLAQIELHGLVLEPIAEAYRRVDRLTPLSATVLLAEAWHAAIALPGLLFGAPCGAAAAAADPLRRRHRRAVLDRSAANGLPAASGARTSLRELGVARTGVRKAPLADREGGVFAREDANLCLAVVERRVREELRPLL